MSTRTFSTVVLGVALTAGVAACGSSGTPVQAAHAATSTPSAVAPTSTSSAVAPATTAPSDNRRSGDGCPVAAADLLTALKNKYDTLPKGQTLRRVRCYSGYAIAGRFTPGFDSDVRTFTYRSGTWKSFTGGSGGYCEGVPAGVQKYFRSHGYPGCA